MLLALPFPAWAQQTGKIFRIGFLDNSTASGTAVLLDAFRQELRKLGWIEGKNITIEYRFAEQKNERLPELAAELVRLKVDLIVTSGGTTPLVAKKATSTIPIVMTISVDPVGAGLVASLARPGGNITGFSGLGPELNTKRLEILKDAVPKLARVGLLRTPLSVQWKEIRPAAVALKLKLEEIETQPDAKGLETAFKTAALPGLLWNCTHHRDPARQSRNQRRKTKFYHEGHEEHEVKKLKNIDVRNLRGLRVLGGEIVLLI